MPGKKKKLLSLAQQVKLFEERETWSTIQNMKEQDWCRKLRKPFDHHLKSNFSFKQIGQMEEEPRCDFVVSLPAHLQRRHFPMVHRKYIYKLFFKKTKETQLLLIVLLSTYTSLRGEESAVQNLKFWANCRELICAISNTVVQHKLYSDFPTINY